MKCVNECVTSAHLPTDLTKVKKVYIFDWKTRTEPDVRDCEMIKSTSKV